MSPLFISGRNLVKLEIGDDGFLVAYPENSKPKKFSLIGITSLNCSRNQLTSLPLLPEGLKELYCYDNLITNLPPLPEGLKSLHCFRNQLTSLPLLPEGLKELYCHDNLITNLPPLPEGLKSLYCYHNRLTSLPLLPAGLEKLDCSYNQLTSLLFPSNVSVPSSLDCFNNPLQYVPFFVKRPRYIVIPQSLKEEHSISNYQKSYDDQEFKRYLFLTIFDELGLQLDFLV